MGRVPDLGHTDCWQWDGGTFSSGYARVGYDGKSQRVHRLFYRLFVGEIPDGLLVLHRCDNRACWNPDHLWLGTSRDNNRDRDSKGRNGNAAKQACPQGHPYNEINTRRTAKGHRLCRTCNRDQLRRLKQARRQQGLCAYCGGRRLLGHAQCDVCRIKSTAESRARRRKAKADRWTGTTRPTQSGRASRVYEAVQS